MRTLGFLTLAATVCLLSIQLHGQVGCTPDVTAPTITCPAGIIVASDPGSSQADLVITPPTVSDNCAIIINDSSFELGTPNSVWTESSSNFGTPLCNIANCGATGTGPNTGDFWCWFGGIAAYEEGSVSQSIDIPTSATTLSFWIQVPGIGDPTDYVELLIDGNQEFVHFATDPTLTYSQQVIDISAYADGNNHTIMFHSEVFALGGTGSNFFIDDVELDGFEPTLTNNITGTNDASGLYDTGETEIIWTGTDAAGNTASCSSFVTVTNSCPTPTNLVITTTGLGGAELTWTENGSATVYDIEYRSLSDPFTDVPTSSGIAQSAIGLSATPGEVDHIQMRADCAASGTGPSDWSAQAIYAYPLEGAACETAREVSAGGTFNSGQITGLYEDFQTCFVSNPTMGNWFVYTAAADGTLNVSSYQIGGTDSQIAIGTGTCGSFTQIACNDDFIQPIEPPYEAEVEVAVTSGTSYYILCGNGWSSAPFDFNVTFVADSPPVTGPDLIAGVISNPGNYNATEGLDAFTLGFSTCNIGDTPLNTVSSTPDHDVVTQNMYRYKEIDGAGRFEQVGMSWIFHGFCSLNTSFCQTCVFPSGDCSSLGSGCSNTIGAGLAGSQSTLGPRWEVNAQTGVFVFPAAAPPYSGNTARRVEVLLSDLEVTNGNPGTARYFGEVHCTAPGDAAAGNQNNNTSWRELTVTGNSADFMIGLSNPTIVEESALQAWADIDPAVTITEIVSASDGVVMLGSKVTDLGDGTFRYEYAVYNMNSDDGIGAFKVPVDPGVTTSNLGFHDVEYRNGDGPGNVNFDGTDWTGLVIGGVLNWEVAESFAQNPGANAIRWGTLYNFRFDADAPPVTGTIRLGRFKTGSNALALAPVPSGPLAVCGDGVIGAGEECDDGNLDSGDGCDAICLSELSTCPADINGDGMVDILDFLEFNSAFGTSCLGCPEDINGDGEVDILDFLELNSAFGTTCSGAGIVGAAPQNPVGISSRLEAALSGIDDSAIHPELNKLIDELRGNVQASLFPNPNKGEQINLDILRSSDLKGNADLRVLNAIGQQVMSRSITVHGEENRVALTFDTSLEAGLYLLTIDLDGETKALRFVVE